MFRRDVHYIVESGLVRIVDETTGRIFEDRSWQDGLHQAIEARENLAVTAGERAHRSDYSTTVLSALPESVRNDGTATGCESEFAEVYRIQVQEIPLRIPSARKLLPTRYFAEVRQKWAAVVDDICTLQKSGRPVLAGTGTIADSEVLSGLLKEAEIEHQLLNGLQNAEEAEIVERAGRRGTVTIATNLAGRGTDISLSPEVREAGGLHVIVTECQISGRMDRQLIGRCARQGDPGSAQIYVSGDDALLQRHGPFMAVCRNPKRSRSYRRSTRKFQRAAASHSARRRTSPADITPADASARQCGTVCSGMPAISELTVRSLAVRNMRRYYLRIRP